MRSLLPVALVLALAGRGAAQQVWKEGPVDVGFPAIYAGFTPDGKTLVLLSGKGEARVGLHDAATGKELKPALKLPVGLAFGEGFGGPFAFSPDHKKLAALAGSFQIGAKRQVRIWDVVARKEQKPLARDFPSITTSPTVNLQPSFAWDPAGQRLVTATESDRTPGELAVWDAATGKRVVQLPPFRENVYSVAFAADGKSVACAGTKNIKVYELAGKKATATLPAANDSHVETLCFTADGKRLVTVHNGAMAAGHAAFLQATAPGAPRPRTPLSAVRVWDLATGKPLTLFAAKKLEDACSLGALSPDGKTFAAQVVKEAGFGELKPGTPPPSPAVYLWDVETGKELAVLEGRKGSLGFASLAFAPDGRRLAATTAEREIRIWERAGSPGEPSQRPDKSPEGR